MHTFGGGAGWAGAAGAATTVGGGAGAEAGTGCCVTSGFGATAVSRFGACERLFFFAAWTVTVLRTAARGTDVDLHATVLPGHRASCGRAIIGEAIPAILS